MPLSEFSDEKRREIEALVALPIPPPRWIRFVGGEIQSRAWHEWHWARGRRLRHVPSMVRCRGWISKALRARVYERDGYACLHCGASKRKTTNYAAVAIAFLGLSLLVNTWMLWRLYDVESGTTASGIAQGDDDGP